LITPPEENSPSKGRKTIAALVVLILILGSGIAYLVETNAAQASTNNASVSSLQSSITGLQQSNRQLQSQLSSPAGSSAGNGNISNNINPEAIYEADNASVVTLQGQKLVNTSTVFGVTNSVETVLGSGFVITYSGSYYVVTNFHVVDGVSNITATFSDGNAYAVKVVGSDPYSDLAVVSVIGAPAKEFIPLDVVPSSGVVVGEPVVVIGNPYGLSGSITFGIVSQLGRTIQESTTNGFSISNIIQFSAPINPGNSGGPLLDQTGQVIGITTADVNGSQGLGFAIPSSTILRELQSLISTGSYTSHSYLGVSTTDMNYQLAQVSGTNVTYGVLVESVVAGGPAAKAGIRAGSTTAVVEGANYLIGGDIIVSVNGTKIINGDSLASYLEANTIAGQTVQLGIIRSGTFTTVDVTLGTRPPA
jgi:S1-C subfamily serine protease